MKGTDYTFTDPLTITFDYDASEVSVPLTINNADSEPKGDRTILLQLQNPLGGSIVEGKDLLEITITDNGMAYPGSDGHKFYLQHLLFHLAILHKDCGLII